MRESYRQGETTVLVTTGPAFLLKKGGGTHDGDMKFHDTDYISTFLKRLPLFLSAFYEKLGDNLLYTQHKIVVRKRK